MCHILLFSFHQNEINISTGSEQRGSSSGQQMENLSHSLRPPTVEIPTIIQRGPARPRPDHLPLESPDPSAHPLYQGLACLTGDLNNL